MSDASKAQSMSVAIVAIGSGLALMFGSFWLGSTSSSARGRNDSGLPQVPRSADWRSPPKSALTAPAVSNHGGPGQPGDPNASSEAVFMVTDEGGRYQVSAPARLWSLVSDPAARAKIHPEAKVAWLGPDGCVGALLFSQRKVVKYAELEPLARRRLKALSPEKANLSWFEATRYNDRPGYRWVASTAAAGQTPKGRYQYSIGEREGWVFEVLAFSPSHFTGARRCHDTVMAAVTF